MIKKLSLDKVWVIYWVITLTFFAFFFASKWFGDVLPLSPREENIPELSYIWNLYHAYKKGVLFAPWNPLQILGTTNLTQRGYFLFAPVAFTAAFFNLNPDILYKILVPLILMLSGLGMCFYLKEIKTHPLSSLIGGFIYAFAPPHLAIGVEGFDFNLYWMIVPWIIFIFEHYINNSYKLTYSITVGLFLSVSLFAGNTYFVATLPFFIIYVFFRLLFTKPKYIFSFISLICLIFLTSSAFITLPGLMEAKYSWIAKETMRKKTVNLISPSQFISLYPKRLSGYSVLETKFYGNHTDMSWYVGIASVFLAFISLLVKKNWTIKLALISLSFALIPFYILLLLPTFKPLFILIVDTIPRLQALYNQTYRLFLLITFSVSGLAAFGADYILSKLAEFKRTVVGVVIFGFVVYDFLPFSSFFKSLPMQEVRNEMPGYDMINNDPNEGRYWSLFPFKSHLPLYKWEYYTRFLTKERVNSSFLYIPFSSRFSGELYDSMILAGFERERLSIQDINTLLEWGNVDYILLRPEVYDYSKSIEQMNEYGFKKIYQTNSLIVLKKKPPGFIRLYSTFQKVPKYQENFPKYWIDSYQNGVVYYTGEQFLSASSSKIDGEIIYWERNSSENVKVEVSLSNPSLLTISQSWYPGWHVLIDGKETNLLRANYALLGAIIPEGQHNVTFFYKQPWYYKLGKLITLAVFVCLIIIAIRSLAFSKVKK